MLEFIFDGGALMYPITLLSIAGFAVIIDRFCAFRVAGRDNDSLRFAVIQAMNEGRYADAVKQCETVGGPVAAVLLLGIQKFMKLKDTGRTMAEVSQIVKGAMEDYAPQVVGVLDRNVGVLPIVASLSPLLGMTGTVTGMISSFDAMANATTLEATTVSAGISEALITTAAGLLVAMPAVIAYNYFSRKVDSYVQEIENAVTALVDFVALDYHA